MKIALFIATPVKANSGMYSVDSAAIKLFESLQLDFEILTTQNDEYELLGRKSRLIHSTNELYDYTHIVYWGDFINNPLYAITDFAMRDVKRKISKNSSIAFDRWSHLFALQSFDKKHLKILSVGNNFHFELNDFPKPSFFKRTDFRSKALEALRSIEDRFDLILPRDNHSKENLTKYFLDENHHKIQEGLDCAFLLEDQKAVIKKNQITIYFFRSALSSLESIPEQIKKIYNYSVLNNPWLNLPNNRQESFEHYTNDMRESLFTITDTYHFAINSLRLGTMSICIGRKENEQVGTLGDFKKKKLYQTLEISEFYIEVDKNDSSQVVWGLINEKIQFILENSEIIQSKLEKINKIKVEQFRKKIIKFLS